MPALIPLRFLNLVLFTLGEENEDDYKTPTGLTLCGIAGFIFHICISEPYEKIEAAAALMATHPARASDLDFDFSQYEKGMYAGLSVAFLGLTFVAEGIRVHGYGEWLKSLFVRDE